MAKQKPKKHKPTKRAKKADENMKSSSTQEIINAMDYMLSVLKARGVTIKNWDDKAVEIGMFRVYKSQAYYMAATKEQIEEKS